MFKNSYQKGILSIFYSCGSNPLGIWDMEVQNGHIKRLTDNEVNSIVLEIVSTNVATTYIACPKNNQVLGITLPFLVMIIKNLKRYFSFEITVLDDKNMRRRFRISNFQSTTKIKPFCTTMPIGLAHGWNQIQFNLTDFTKRAYGTQFVETQRVQVHANARLRRIYFSERLYTEEELPQDFKLYLPLERKQKKGKEKKGPEVPAAPPSEAAAPTSAARASEAALVAKSSKRLVAAPEAEPEKVTQAEKAAGEATEPPKSETPAEAATPAADATPAEGATPAESATPAETATPAEGEVTPAEGEAPPEATEEAPAEAPAEAPPEAPAESAAEGE